MLSKNQQTNGAYLCFILNKTNLGWHHNHIIRVVSCNACMMRIFCIIMRFKTLDTNRQILQFFMYKYINTNQIDLALSVIEWISHTMMILNHIGWYVMYVTIRAQEKAIWLSIVKRKSTKLEWKLHLMHHLNHAHVAKHLSCGRLSTITRSRAGQPCPMHPMQTNHPRRWRW